MSTPVRLSDYQNASQAYSVTYLRLVAMGERALSPLLACVRGIRAALQRSGAGEINRTR